MWSVSTHKFIQPFKHVFTSRDKLKTYLLYHDAYGHKTSQGDDIPQGAPTHKCVWPHNEVVMWGHMINYISYISTCRRPMDIKLGKMQT